MLTSPRHRCLSLTSCKVPQSWLAHSDLVPVPALEGSDLVNMPEVVGAPSTKAHEAVSPHSVHVPKVVLSVPTPMVAVLV